MLITLISILGVTIADPPTRGTDANCSSCHGSNYYLRVDVISVEAPATIGKGETGDVTVTVEVTGDGKTSDWQFDMTVKLASINSKVTVSSQQSFNNQRPSGSSEPYKWTKDVVFTITGRTGGSDTLRGTATMDPDHKSPAVSHSMDASIVIQNNAPVLSTGSVSPLSGSETTQFGYEVTYVDQDGDEPAFVKAHIDGTSYEMTSKDGTVDTVTTGEVFSVDGITLGPGSHEFYFETSDGEESASLGASSPFPGPDVIDSNDPPVLSDPGVDPAGGNPDSIFSFSVTYADENDDPPENGLLLYIDDDTIGIPMNLDTDAPSHRQDGDFTDGEDYIHRMILSEGNHHYSFSAEDGEFDVTSGPHTGPAVSSMPLLIVSILKPDDLEGFLTDEVISFSGAFSSNVEITDEEYSWDSNISGIIGEEPDFSLMLPAGHHNITFGVSSSEFDLSDEAFISIFISEPEPDIPPFQIRDYSPSGDTSIDETEDITFSVDYRINRGDPILYWYFNGDKTVEDVGEWTYESAYDSSGVHEIELIIRDPVEEYQISIIWNLTVNDVPAPILIDDDIPEDLGDFNYGDQIEVTADLSDPLDRDLIIVWKIDNVTIRQSGGILRVTAGGSIETMAGDHIITIMAQNPDGATAEFYVSFSVLEPAPVDDDEPDDDDDADDDDGNGDLTDTEDDSGGDGRKLDLGLGPLKEEWAGYLIMIAGILGTMAGIIYSVMVLMPEKPKRDTWITEENPDDDGSVAIILED